MYRGSPIPTSGVGITRGPRRALTVRRGGARPQRTVVRPRWYKRRGRTRGARGYGRGSVTTNVADALGVSLGGLAQKRGLIPRVPDGDKLLAEAAVWLTGEYPDAVRSTRQRTLPGGEAALSVDLHPAVAPFVLTANDEGRVTAVADTGVAGPGYHRFVGRVISVLGVGREQLPDRGRVVRSPGGHVRVEPTLQGRTVHRCPPSRSSPRERRSRSGRARARPPRGGRA